MLIPILSAEVAVCLLAGILFGIKDIPLRAAAVFALVFFLASPLLINQVMGVYDFQFLLIVSGLGAAYFALGWMWTEGNC